MSVRQAGRRVRDTFAPPGLDYRHGTPGVVIAMLTCAVAGDIAHNLGYNIQGTGWAIMGLLIALTDRFAAPWIAYRIKLRRGRKLTEEWERADGGDQGRPDHG